MNSLFVVLLGTLPLLPVHLAAQSVQVDEQSMREAWSDQQPEFESLSDEPGYYDSGAGYDFQNDSYTRRPSSQLDIDEDIGRRDASEASRRHESAD